MDYVKRALAKRDRGAARSRKPLMHRDERTGCLLWDGPKTAGGYGVVDVYGARVYVHRMAFEMAYGPIPVGKQVCHRCDVRNCFEATHLWPGSFAENMGDMVLKKRGVRGIPIGEVGDDFAERRLVPAVPYAAPHGPVAPSEPSDEDVGKRATGPTTEEFIRRHLAFGAGARSIARTLELPVAEVQRVINTLRE